MTLKPGLFFAKKFIITDSCLLAIEGVRYCFLGNSVALCEMRKRCIFSRLGVLSPFFSWEVELSIQMPMRSVGIKGGYNEKQRTCRLRSKDD